jgi:hypothetical protein
VIAREWCTAERALSYATLLAGYLFVLLAQIEKHRAKRKSGERRGQQAKKSSAGAA